MSWIPARWRFDWHDTVASTNDLLKQAARSGAEGGTVVVARRQSAGRGRGDHGWASPPGGLYVSVLLRDVPGSVATVLPLAAGVAVLDAIDRFDLDVRTWLKWPNDILVAARDAARPDGKAGGILTESGSQGGDVAWAVVGVGLDLTVPPEALPQADPPARSLVQYDPLTPHVEQFLATFLDRFGAALEATAAAAHWPARTAAARLAYRGEDVSVTIEGAPVTGILVGLTDDGRLRLATGGQERTLAAWQASLLRPTA